ncbi:MAG: type 1 glutamine amidotransferase [Candidatus Dormibacteraeota bacterium]|nr:type 1 glutamine amidotransferase [Candidatus Dormibacteraeota bacterium]
MRIACVLTNGYEDSEFQMPYDEFKSGGREVVVIASEAGLELKGKKGTSVSRSDMGIDQAAGEKFDALLIPGGASPDQLRADPRFVQFIKPFFAEHKPVMAICHGPQLMIAADEHRNHRMTAWKTIQDDLRKMGANVVDEEVVVDGNLITSRQPSDIPAFIRESIAVMDRAPALR